MQKMKRIICIFISILMVGRVLAYSEYQVKASEDEAEELIYKLVELENDGKWDEYPDLWCEETKNTFKALFANEQYVSERTGILGVDSAEISSIEKISSEDLMYFISEFVDEYSNIECYLTGIKYTTENVTKSFYNGVNYRLIVVGEENNTKKILAVMEAPESLLDEGIQSYDKEIAKDIIDARKNGYILDSDMTVVDEYGTISENESESSNTDDSTAQLYGYNPGYSYDTVYNLRIPETIKVGILCEYDESGHSTDLAPEDQYIEEVPMYMYIKRVLPRELQIDGCPMEALKAQVVCIQQYAIFNSVYFSKHPNTGYDLDNTPSDQAYDYYYDSFSSDYANYKTKVDDAYKAAYQICMVVKSTGALFESLYCENKTYNKNIGHGTLYQEGAVALANAGRTYLEILHGYYNNTMLYYNSPILEISFKALYK